MHIIGLGVHSPEWGASMRYRLAQYQAPLINKGIKLSIHPFATSLLQKTLYERYSPLIKCAAILESFVRWIPSLKTQADLFIIQREAMPFGPPVIESFLSRYKPIIYDFDDAIWLQSNSRINGSFAKWTRPSSKTKRLIEISNLVIAGNSFLAQYAQQYHSNVRVIPTVVDCQKFIPLLKNDSIPTVGWIGSHSTTPYLETIIPAIIQTAQHHQFQLYIVGADRSISIPNIPCVNKPWIYSKELEDFQQIDIGLYPLHNTLWEQGKCAFKAIQYGALSIPSVCSPVGMNKDVVIHGITGWYASSLNEWQHYLSILLQNHQQRFEFGRKARLYIEEHFNSHNYVKHLTSYIQQVVYD